MHNFKKILKTLKKAGVNLVKRFGLEFRVTSNGRDQIRRLEYPHGLSIFIQSSRQLSTFDCVYKSQVRD